MLTRNQLLLIIVLGAALVSLNASILDQISAHFNSSLRTKDRIIVPSM